VAVVQCYALGFLLIFAIDIGDAAVGAQRRPSAAPVLIVKAAQMA
jgi:hypothetical protein